MKRASAGILSAALLFPTLAACGGDSDFCEASPDINSNDLGAMADSIEPLVDDAPDEIKGDLEVIVEEFRKFEEDPTSVDAEALTEAGENLTAWEQENCS